MGMPEDYGHDLPDFDDGDEFGDERRTDWVKNQVSAQFADHDNKLKTGQRLPKKPRFSKYRAAQAFADDVPF